MCEITLCGLSHSVFLKYGGEGVGDRWEMRWASSVPESLLVPFRHLGFYSLGNTGNKIARFI